MHPQSPGREVCSDSLLPGLLHPKKNCVGCGKGMWLLLETKNRQAGSSGTRLREQPARWAPASLQAGQRAPEWTQGLALADAGLCCRRTRATNLDIPANQTHQVLP